MYYPRFAARFAVLLSELRGKKVVVIGHQRPDADCIGSQVALCRLLRSHEIGADGQTVLIVWQPSNEDVTNFQTRVTSWLDAGFVPAGDLPEVNAQRNGPIVLIRSNMTSE